MAERNRLKRNARLTPNDLDRVLRTRPWNLQKLVTSPLKSILWSTDNEAPPTKASWLGRRELSDVSQQLPFNTCFAHSLCRALETTRSKAGLSSERLDADMFHQCVVGRNCNDGVEGAEEICELLTRLGAPRVSSNFKPDDACPAPLPTTSKANGVLQIESEQDAKLAIARYGPIVALISAEQKFGLIKDDAAYRDRDGPRDLHHALLLIGYDDEKGFWEVQNSFGTGWGKKGRGRIAYGQAALFADQHHRGFLVY